MFGWFGKRRADAHKLPPRPEPACFICDGTPPLLDQDGPGHWLDPRLACRDHCDTALLSSGEPLAGFLRRHSGAHQLEGSGLGWLLNPVHIAGRRVWADFAGGGWAVFEEVFASESQFEFWAQHRSDCVDALYQMYPPAGTPAHPPAPRRWAGCVEEWRGILAGQWAFHHRVADGFRRRGTRDFSSPAEMLEMLDFCMSLHPLDKGAVSAECDGYLRGLAGRRFQRLRGPA